jgi:hypothetical protein
MPDIGDGQTHGDYHCDVDALRPADAEDQRPKIYEGAPAVRPAAAAA